MSARPPFVDQAHGLRRLLGPVPVQVLPVFGAAERTSVCVHLATAAVAQGRGVVVLDASAGEVARALGVAARYELKHLLQGEKSFEEVVLELPSGVRLLPGLRGVEMLAGAGGRGDALFGAFGRLSRRVDLVIVNAPDAPVAGALPAAAGESLIALSPAADSVTRAFACMKRLNLEHGHARFRTLVMHADETAARMLHERFVSACAGRLRVELSYGGAIPGDPCLRQAESACRTIFDVNPGAVAARAFRNIAAGLAAWPLAAVGAADAALAA